MQNGRGGTKYSAPKQTYFSYYLVKAFHLPNRASDKMIFHAKLSGRFLRRQPLWKASVFHKCDTYFMRLHRLLHGTVHSWFRKLPFVWKQSSIFKREFHVRTLSNCGEPFFVTFNNAVMYYTTFAGKTFEKVMRKTKDQTRQTTTKITI